jgi:YD repeat-containing protein
LKNLKKRKETFNYDEINRLTASGSVESGRSEYRYDQAGRIKYKGGVGDYSYVYTDRTFSSRCETRFPPAVGKLFHAVKNASHGSYDDDYCYDLDGNLISSSAGHFDYTSDNHLKLLYLDEQKSLAIHSRYVPIGIGTTAAAIGGAVSRTGA